MPERHQFVEIEFKRFKAFEHFVLRLRHFNILVGPNNAGKSTILAAFRILAAALRKASSRKPEIVTAPGGRRQGYVIDLRSISVAEENIFYNYDESQAATVNFKLSNKNELLLYFPEPGSCHLIAEAHGREIATPTAFRTHFNCPIGFVPILGPVEHIEYFYEKEAARLALYSYGAARNFRNIWYHFPEKFDEFRNILRQTWPGMDIEQPQLVLQGAGLKPRLDMFCPEERIPREIFWSGFGFQVWCQMLTHLIQSNDTALFMIDEPDIYLHSELQRQLIGLLRNLGPDILIATHSTEIIMEAEADEIVLISKKRKSARRINNPSQLEDVFAILGSNLNPILTQLAKTRRALFVEGKDFQIISQFARKLGLPTVGNRSDFAVIPIEGFNPERIRNLIMGMETTLGGRIVAAALLDRDYRSDAESDNIVKTCMEFCRHVVIHKRKEIENFLLVPDAVDRAAAQRCSDRAKRSGVKSKFVPLAAQLLEQFSNEKKSHVVAQYLAFRRRYERQHHPSLDEATVNEAALREFDQSWTDPIRRNELIPGKEAMGAINGKLQQEFGISVTSTAIIEAMRVSEVPAEMRELVSIISTFAKERIAGS